MGVAMRANPEGRGHPGSNSATAFQRVAIALLAVFLIAIIVALAITLSSVAPPVRILAGSVVTPIIVLTAFFLYFELRGRPWSFAGAAALGALGVGLRLIVNSHPQLEVGGGLPLAVTVVYTSLGILVVVTSLWVFFSLQKVETPASRTVSDPP
jgi:hypothetical protein